MDWSRLATIEVGGEREREGGREGGFIHVHVHVNVKSSTPFAELLESSTPPPSVAPSSGTQDAEACAETEAVASTLSEKDTAMLHRSAW